MKRGEKMKESTKKLTALFLSMCMTTSVASVSTVSASALDGEENPDVNISGMSGIEFIGKYNAKYVSPSGDRLVRLTVESGVYCSVTDDAGIKVWDYDKSKEEFLFIAENGMSYNVNFDGWDRDASYRCAVYESEVTKLNPGEAADAEIVNDGDLCAFSYTPGETGKYKLKGYGVPYHTYYTFLDDNGTQATRTLGDGNFVAEMNGDAGKPRYYIFGLKDGGSAGFGLKADYENSIELYEQYRYYDFDSDEGTKTAYFKAPSDMRVLVKRYLYGSKAKKMTVTDSENNILGEFDDSSVSLYFNSSLEVKKGEVYSFIFEHSGGHAGFFLELNELLEIAPDIPFRVEFIGGKTDIYCRYVAQSDAVLNVNSENGNTYCQLFDEEFNYCSTHVVNKGETYHIRLNSEDVYTITEKPVEDMYISPGETKEITASRNRNTGMLLFKPEKDEYIHCYPSATSDEADVACYIGTIDGGHVNTKYMDNGDEYSDARFKAKAGEVYVIYYTADRAVDIRVTMEETAPYIIEDGIFKGKLTEETDLTIPAAYNPPFDPGNPGEFLNPEGGNAREVTGIASGALAEENSLINVEIPDTVKKIDKEAFYSCRELETVRLSSNLEVIGDSAFRSDQNLKKITIPDSVTEIGERAFEFCSTMDEVKLSKNLGSIAPRTFANCFSLKEIEIPGSVKQIGNNAFDYCIPLKKLTIAEGVEKIGVNAFQRCGALKEVTIPRSVKVLESYAFGYSDEWDYDEEYNLVRVKYDGFTIKGCRGTEAERYANDNGFTFIALDDGEPNPTVYGDANGDGEIDISDVTAIQKYAAAYEKFNAAQLKYADVNKDGEVDINDATAVQKYIAGIIKSFD